MVTTEGASNALPNKTVVEVAQHMTYNLSLTESQVQNLIEFFEFQFIDMIRRDEEIDNVAYIADMMEVYKGLKTCEHDINAFKNQLSQKNEDDNGAACSVHTCFNPHEIVTAF